MIVIDIDEITGREPAEHPKPGKARTYSIPRDKKGNPVGTPWEKVLEEMYNDLSEHYGIDLRTL
jgi:hypothetical protein